MGRFRRALVHTGVDAAVAHLGTMGVYGYGWSGSAPVPEGYRADLSKIRSRPVRRAGMRA